jgi:hypothetical protein
LDKGIAVGLCCFEWPVVIVGQTNCSVSWDVGVGGVVWVRDASVGDGAVVVLRPVELPSWAKLNEYYQKLDESPIYYDSNAIDDAIAAIIRRRRG